MKPVELVYLSSLGNFSSHPRGRRIVPFLGLFSGEVLLKDFNSVLSFVSATAILLAAWRVAVRVVLVLLPCPGFSACLRAP